ncbi:unnamed protein product [Clonostachys rosea f. rosea IK726]|uniref:Xylanolytic transcriptional activator regulatory domain-containing protein n=2 Tax=Bionectria ochroleuca TaxID=29856 RepID=A0A0B7JRZ0_BIOOC|nr:unnamed protein product [Clonostachys rosea f. rosea IK726]
MAQGAVIGSSVPPSTDTAPVQPPGVPNGPSPTTTIPALSRGHGNDPQSDVSLGQNTLGHASPADTSLGLAPSRFAELYGLGSDMEPILMKYRPYDSSTHEFCLETHAIRRVLDKDDGQEYPLTFHVAADEKALEADADLSQVTAIENCVTPHGPTLLDLFWRHVQPCYPILSKDVFMQVYKRSFKCVPAALLGAIYLSALRWWGYDAELSLYPPPNAATLRRLIYKSLPICYHRPKLSSIQATLLLLQCQPEDPLNPGHTFQWGLTCQALAIGQCLGLHLDARSWSIPPWERNVRKRLSWALYMQDRWTALAYGRPVHIHDDDWTTEDLTEADFADNEDHSPLNQGDKQRSFVFTGMLQYINMVQLTKILSSALSTFYTARASRGQDTILLYQRAQPLFEALRQWSNNIPPELQMGITYQRKLCFHGYLHFSYHGVMITLLRRLIRSTILPPRCVDDQVLADIRQLALQTAQGAIAFVTNLRPDHLEAFWYFTSPYLFSLLGSFTTLLLVTSLSSQERTFWQETLNSYLWTLRVMSKSSGPMQYAVNRLEGAILRGLEHSLAVNLNEPIDDNVGPDVASFQTAQTFEFTDFGDWDLAADGAYDLLSGMILSPEGLTMRGDTISGRDIRAR